MRWPLLSLYLKAFNNIAETKWDKPKLKGQMMRHCICDAGCAKVQAMLEEMDLDPKLDMVPLLCRHAGAVWKPASALMSSVVCRFEFPHGPSCSQLLRMQRESWRSLSPGLRAMASLYERALFEKLYPMTKAS